MVKSEALKQASYEAKFIENQPPVFQVLRLEYALDVAIDTARLVFRIQCHGNTVAAALVEGIKSALVIPDRWRVEID